MVEKDMIYAPIYITTLCRSKHFIREVESLKRNPWATYTDVYIAVDYPAKDSHRKGYDEIINYLDSGDFSDFASFNVIKRNVNYGSSKNSKEMRNYILEKYDRWIYAEDDLEFSPNFLEYMDKCLMKFYDDTSVLAINGYSYPLKWKCENASTVIRQGWTCSTWGIGHWKYKYLNMRGKIVDGYLYKSFDEVYKDGRINNLIKGRYFDYITYALTGESNNILFRTTDIAIGIYMSVDNMHVITPYLSKVRNYGFDGSGEYCAKVKPKNKKHSLSYSYSSQPIDTADSFAVFVDDSSRNADFNKNLLDAFLHTSLLAKIKALVLLCAYRLLGQNATCRLYQKLRNVKSLLKNN